MSKINVVVHPKEFTSFKALYLRPIFDEYFTITRFDKSATYSKNTLFVTGLFRRQPWIDELINSGYKVIVDNLWEQEDAFGVVESAYVLLNKNWFWYNESLWFEDLGYKTYVPNRNYSKLAFMPINLRKPSRDKLVNNLGNRVNDFIYSYNSVLVGDDRSRLNWQRYFNPTWYDSTYFSLVVETTVEYSKFNNVFITEKTYKPMAFKHPFLIYGPPEILKNLKDNGFETYKNLFDESYDPITNIDDKINAIINNVDNFKQVPYDQITLDKIEHNYNHFYNKSLVLDKIKKEVIDPMIEYAETR